MNKSIAQMITERFIEELKKGCPPWKKSWHGVGVNAISHLTGQTYSILNQMLLPKPGEYITFNQVKKEGGKVKRGEKSNIIVFWNLKEYEKKDNVEEKIKVPILQYYKVFHIEQCENIEPKYFKESKQINTILEAEKIKLSYTSRENLEIRETLTNYAFYDKNNDYIQVPVINQYENPNDFYSTLFHEMVHSTGHFNRLNRFNKDDKLNDVEENSEYSKEELVAEISSAALLNMIGIETDKTFKESASYLNGWIKTLENDVNFIISAAGKADKAVNYILGNNIENRK